MNYIYLHTPVCSTSTSASTDMLLLSSLPPPDASIICCLISLLVSLIQCQLNQDHSSWCVIAFSMSFNCSFGDINKGMICQHIISGSWTIATSGDIKIHCLLQCRSHCWITVISIFLLFLCRWWGGQWGWGWGGGLPRTTSTSLLLLLLVK